MRITPVGAKITKVEGTGPAKVDRTKFLGSSEMGAILGLDPYKSPLRLWAMKTGRISPNVESEAAEWGIRLEDVVAQKFSEKNNCKLMAYKTRYVHPKYGFISCELDRLLVGTDELLEVKTCNEYLKKNWTGEDMPQGYCVQLNTAMGLSNRKRGHVALLAGGQKYLEKHMDFDKELYDMTIDRAVAFWDEFVLGDKAPVATAQDNDETIELLYPLSNPHKVELTDELAKELDVLVEDRSGAVESRNHLNEEMDKIEARLKQILAEAEVIETENSYVTWKSQSRTSIDTDKLKTDGLYDTYKKVSQSRTLRTKRRTT